MAIAKDNARISVKFSKEELEEIKLLADKENRSTSNFIYNLVVKSLEEHKKDQE